MCTANTNNIALKVIMPRPYSGMVMKIGITYMITYCK